MVNGQQIPPLGRAELSLTIGTKSIKADLLILEMRGIDVLLGNDVLRRFKTLEIEYGTGKPKMRFGELPASLVLEDPHTGPTNKIITSKGIRIPARSMAAVEVVQNLNQDLTEEEIDDIERALRDNGDCFARDGDQLGRCNVAEHETHLSKNTGPIDQAPRQTSWKEEEIQRDLTTEMLRKKVIERGSGLWGARVLLLQKKDGTWRFCLDFRPLVMPFGLCTAQATFQRTMDMVPGELRRTTCLVYLDDIIVYASNTEEHTKRLRLVLEALQEANLKLKLPKCRFGESAITALRHRINADGISPDPEKIGAVARVPPPSPTAKRTEKVKLIKSYLGLCSYYRRHIPGFTEIAKPLFDLTKEETVFIWTTAHKTSFDMLKELLSKATTLAYPDQEKADINTKDAPSLGTEPVKKSVRFEHQATEDDNTDQEEPTTTSNTERNENPKDPVTDVPPTHDITQTERETDGKSTTPETRQQTEETPRQQQDALPDEQTRRYPLRIRRNRFALASTLLCGLLTTLTLKPELTQATTSNGMAHHPTWRYPAILLATLHLRPTEGVATTTTMAHYTIWWSTTLLLTTVRPQPVEGTREVKLSNYGVIFQSLGERSFSNSEWTVVTDTSFDHGDKMTKELKRWLTEKSILPTPPAIHSGYNIVERPPVNESSKPFISNSGVMPNTEKIQYMIATLVRERAMYERTRLETIEKDYLSLKTSLKKYRQKRGMVDGGGRIPNWLFGVSTTEELDKVNNQVEKLSTETTAIVHAIETHTTLINETRWELQANKKTTDALQRSCLTLDKELANTRNTVDNLSREMEWEWKTRDKIDNRPTASIPTLTHRQYTSQHHVLAVQMSTLKGRIQQHEDEVSDTPPENVLPCAVGNLTADRPSV
jgi:cell division septum initiation protein DivIVA